MLTCTPKENQNEDITIYRNSDYQDTEGTRAGDFNPKDRQHGISEGTFYKWKTKYGGMEKFSYIEHIEQITSDFCP